MDNIILTHSALVDYLSCPYKFYLSYIKLIDPSKPPMYWRPSLAMAKGSIYHKAYELYHTTGQIDKDALTSYAKKEFSYFNHLSYYITEAKTLIEEMVQQEGDTECFGYEQPLTVKATELQLDYRLDDTILTGKLDAIVEDKNSNQYVYENKTTRRYIIEATGEDISVSTVDHQSYDQRERWRQKYLLNWQVNFYVLLAQLSGDYPVIGGYVNLIRTSSLKYSGLTQEEWQEKLLLDIRGNSSKPAKLQTYFGRSYIPKTKENMEWFLENLVNIIDSIQHDARRNYFYANISYCNEYKDQCQYSPVCIAVANGKKLEELGLSTKDIHHVELDMSELYNKYPKERPMF